jgi:hypothetical protein
MKSGAESEGRIQSSPNTEHLLKSSHSGKRVSDVFFLVSIVPCIRVKKTSDSSGKVPAFPIVDIIGRRTCCPFTDIHGERNRVTNENHLSGNSQRSNSIDTQSDAEEKSTVASLLLSDDSLARFM